MRSYTSKVYFQLIGSIIIGIVSVIVNYSSCSTLHQSDFSSDVDVKVEVHFTPDDPCLNIIIHNILSAKKMIFVQAYVITSKKIVDALIQAHLKKVNVQLLVDKNAPTTKGSQINFILEHGIPVIVDKTIGLAHNKIMIIDDSCVITGSFNWTHGAQNRNAENIVIIRGKCHNEKFKKNWYRRAALGEKLKTKNGFH
ncbi:phospholipase D family protein [Cardinium endosymbiont of Culicoides punctatus]|uniref:phospholipase D family nuclease n=1 Tax=Cardinium endosymbiont of Culicoides punctatus TaxID=2304601 RepID=UPI001404FFCF|nr:phospholipase D family protein [Cardinium endosymbiont of Culicoides punctatus]